MTLSWRRAATVLAAAALPALVALPAAAAEWPLRPRPAVVRGFEPPPSAWLPGHRGVDLAGSPGQPVLSATAGTITYAGQLAGRGVVVVSNGPTRTTYEPVVASVRKGATVAAGEPLGRLSAAGSHCSPAVCLHWGLLRGDEYLDPLSTLRSAPVRLLPLDSVRPEARDVPEAAPNVAASGMRMASASEREAGSEAGSEAGGDAAGGIVVGLAAAATVGAGLLVRRH